MNRLLLRSALLLLLLPSLVAAQDSESSTWKGTLNAMGTKLRLEIEISDEGGKASGILRSLDQGNVELQLENVRFSEKVLKFTVPKIGASYYGKITSKKTYEGNFQQAGLKFPLSLSEGTFGDDDAKEAATGETLREAWVGELALGPMKPVMQFRIVTTKDDKTKAYFDSITEGITGLDVTEWSDADGELFFEVQRIKLTYRGELNDEGTKATGVFAQGGREFPLTLEKKTEETRDENTWDGRPQKPVGPFPYDAEEVTFENTEDDVTLAGTLMIPKKGDKFPVAILISGSGPQDRDETLMGHKPFLVLADYLGRNGIAVLRYDDRGTAKSTGKHSTATSEDFARDASAAVEFLKTHSKIDASKIGLCGHSEGGLIAPIVSSMRKDVAFIVMMAGTGVDGKTIIMSQSEAMALAEGETAEDAKLSGTIAGELVDLAVAGRLDDEEAVKPIIDRVIKAAEDSEEEQQMTSDQLRMMMKANIKRMDGPWMKYFLAYDPGPALEKVTCPVLSIIGSKDTQVLPDLNQPAIRAALEKGGNKNFEIVDLEGLNHLFQECETGGLSEYAKIAETFNPEALKRIGDWIEAQVK